MFRYAWPMVRIVICPCSCIGVHFLADLYFCACLRFADGRFLLFLWDTHKEALKRKAVTTYVSDKTIEKIIKLLRCAFKQAVLWEIIARNPFDNVILTKTEYAKRDIWTADMIRLALDKCTDSKLYVAMNLSFACSLRIGEILGLTWENVHISDEDIAADNAYVYIDKELTRASKLAIETLGEKDINAQKFETAFYAKLDLRNVRPPEEPAKSAPATLDLESLVEQLQKSPEPASALATLIAAQAPAK